MNIPKHSGTPRPASARLKKDGPVRIVSFMGHQAFGNFVLYQYVSASIAKAIPGAEMLSVFRNDRSYKPFINRLNPYVTESLILPGEDAMGSKANKHVMPLDLFDGTGTLFRATPGLERLERFADPDIFLTPSMLGDVIEGSALPPPPQFRIPGELAAPLDKALVDQGVDRKKWIAVLHVRESNYEHRKHDTAKMSEEQLLAMRCRDADPLSYIPMINRIIRDLGGQVVRVGDPSMGPLPKMRGLVDLSQIRDSFALQACAMSRARFGVFSASGPLALAGALGTPSACANTCVGGAWNEGDIVLPKKVSIGGCPPLGKKDLENYIAHLPVWLFELKFENNHPDQLVEVADMMFERTANCPGWREKPPSQDHMAPYEGPITLPLKGTELGDLDYVTWL